MPFDLARVRACYYVVGATDTILYASLDDALTAADAINTAADGGVDPEGRGRAVVVPAITILYPPEPDPEPDPTPDPPPDGNPPA